jgi:Flp pilus assembly protein TadG
MLLKRIKVEKKGQAVVETALILPIIILILMGIIDFGLMFNNYLVINNAAREGARNAAVGSSDANIKNMILNMTTTLDHSKLTTTIHPAELLRKKGEEVTVTIEYDNRLITPIISAIVPNPLHLKAKTVMRIE